MEDNHNALQRNSWSSVSGSFFSSDTSLCWIILLLLSLRRTLRSQESTFRQETRSLQKNNAQRCSYLRRNNHTVRITNNFIFSSYPLNHFIADPYQFDINFHRFGVVCAFVTNEYMQEGTKELPSNVKTNLKDVKLYLGTTKLEINNLLVQNYKELEITLNSILRASGKIVTEQLAEYSHAVSLTNLNNIVAGLDMIKRDLDDINKITTELRLNASELDISEFNNNKTILKTESCIKNI